MDRVYWDQSFTSRVYLPISYPKTFSNKVCTLALWYGKVKRSWVKNTGWIFFKMVFLFEKIYNKQQGQWWLIFFKRCSKILLDFYHFSGETLNVVCSASDRRFHQNNLREQHKCLFLNTNVQKTFYTFT